MKGTEKILARISSEAGAACLGIAQEWNEQCNAVRKEAEAKAAELYETTLAAGKAEADAQVQRLDRNVRLDAKKDILALKQELVGKAFALAEEKLTGMSGEKYVEFLASLAAEAAVDGAELILSAKDRAAVGDAVVKSANEKLGGAKTLVLSGESREMRGGVVLRSGDVEINCSIEALLEQSRNELAARVAAILFA